MNLNKVVSALFAALLFGILPLMGCHENSPVTDSVTGLQTGTSMEKDGGNLIGVDVKDISQLGGTMKVSQTILVVPARAVDWTYKCTFRLYAMLPPAGLASALKRVYDFGPEGTEFALPAILTVPFSDTDLGTADPSLLKCYYYNTSTRRYEVQATIVDRVNKKFIVEINHFSQYAFGRVTD